MAQLNISSATQVQSLPQAPARQAAPAQAPAAQAALQAALQNTDALQTYTVKKGDNLWNISKAHLGDATQWPAIHQLNRSQINNPNLIYPNQVLTLPIKVQQPAVPVAPPPVASEPAVPAPVQPVAPAPPAQTAPAQPAPAQPAHPVHPAPAQPVKPKSSLLSDVGKVAAVGGAVGAVGTAAALTAITASLSSPLSNFGGYATAQIVAKKAASIGLPVAQGPALSKLVSAVGGPKVAAAGVAIGIGLAVAGVAAGSYYLYRKASDH